MKHRMKVTERQVIERNYVIEVESEKDDEEVRETLMEYAEDSSDVIELEGWIISNPEKCIYLHDWKSSSTRSKDEFIVNSVEPITENTEVSED